MNIMHISRASIMINNFLTPILIEQKQRGYSVFVCCDDDSKLYKLNKIGIKAFSHSLKRNNNPLNILGAIIKIKKILIKNNIDVVICHSPIGALVGRIAALWARIPKIIYFAHGLPCAPGQNKVKWLFFFLLEKILGLFTTGILVMNKYDQVISEKYRIGKRVLKIPPIGVNTNKFNISNINSSKKRIKMELNLRNEIIIILCTAKLTKEKGVLILLNAAKRICAKRKDICFLLAGHGPLADKLNEMVSFYKLNPFFKVLGWRNDIEMLMKAADIFVLPTYYNEGAPVSILEAMACGKPVITTKHRGCEDLITDGETGLLVPVRRISQITNKLILLVENKQLRDRLGIAANEKVQKFFTSEKCLEQQIFYIEKLIKDFK